MEGFFIQVPKAELLLSETIQCLCFSLPPPRVALEAKNIYSHPDVFSYFPWEQFSRSRSIYGIIPSFCGIFNCKQQLWAYFALMQITTSYLDQLIIG